MLHSIRLNTQFTRGLGYIPLSFLQNYEQYPISRRKKSFKCEKVCCWGWVVSVTWPNWDMSVTNILRMCSSYTHIKCWKILRNVYMCTDWHDWTALALVSDANVSCKSQLLRYVFFRARIRPPDIIFSQGKYAKL